MRCTALVDRSQKDIIMNIVLIKNQRKLEMCYYPHNLGNKEVLKGLVAIVTGL